jgi:hypothetical protein
VIRGETSANRKFLERAKERMRSKAVSMSSLRSAIIPLAGSITTLGAQSLLQLVDDLPRPGRGAFLEIAIEARR